MDVERTGADSSDVASAGASSIEPSSSSGGGATAGPDANTAASAGGSAGAAGTTGASLSGAASATAPGAGGASSEVSGSASTAPEAAPVVDGGSAGAAGVAPTGGPGFTAVQGCRGKLYALSQESAWEDTGTGHASVVESGAEAGGASGGRRLVFNDEETGEAVHNRPVFSSDIYQLQGDGDRLTIIVWEDVEEGKDWALSFQDPDGAARIYQALGGQLSPAAAAPSEPTAGSAKAAAEAETPRRLLPLPAMGTLTDLGRLLSFVLPNQREPVAAECARPEFLDALRDTFHAAEDLGSKDTLLQLWNVAKGILLLSNQKLTERYMAQDVYEDIFGMLEYDAGLPEKKRPLHRQIMRSKVHFKSPVAFEDAEMLERIHLNHRLLFLKDYALPRILDDASFMALTQMIQGNFSLIFDHLQRSPRLLEQVLVQVQQEDQDSLLFLLEACRCAKNNIAPSERQALYEKMVERKFFESMLPFFRRGRGEAVEVILHCAFTEASHLRRFLTSGSEGRELLSGLIRAMINEQDQGIQSQLFETLKYVIDVQTLEQSNREHCLDTLYEGGAMDELVAPLRDDCVGKAMSPPVCFAQQLACELLAFAVTNHAYRAKNFVMRHGLVQYAMKLMGAPQRYLQLAPVRLVKAIIHHKDDYYNRYLARTNLFAPVMRSFRQSVVPPALGGNLLVSAVLDMLEFIRVENIKLLVDHICKKFDSMLQELKPKFKVLEGLLLRHQQNLEYEAFPPEQHPSGGPRGGMAGQSRRMRSPGRNDSDDEEAYFESLEEDDEIGGPGDDRAGADMPDQGSGLTDAAAPNSGPSGSPGQVAAGGSAPAAASDLKGLLGGYEDDDDEEEINIKQVDAGGTDVAPLPDEAHHGTADGGAAGGALPGATATVDSVANPRAPPGPQAKIDEDATPAPSSSPMAGEGSAGGAMKRCGEAEESDQADHPAEGAVPSSGSRPGSLAGSEDSLLKPEPRSASSLGDAASAAAGRDEACAVMADATDGAPDASDASRNTNGEQSSGQAATSEKGLNHVSKRLKTSASVEPA